MNTNPRTASSLAGPSLAALVPQYRNTFLSCDYPAALGLLADSTLTPPASYRSVNAVVKTEDELAIDTDVDSEATTQPNTPTAPAGKKMRISEEDEAQVKAEQERAASRIAFRTATKRSPMADVVSMAVKHMTSQSITIASQPPPVSAITDAKPDTNRPPRRFSISTQDLEKANNNTGLSRLADFTQLFMKRKTSSVSISPETVLLVRNSQNKVHRFSLHHNSPRRQLWNVLVLLMICIDVVITSFSVGFNYNSRFFLNMNKFTTAIFVTDFVANMLTSYMDERGVLVSGPENTIRHYMLSVWAPIDIVAWLPFEDLMKNSQGHLFEVIKVLRLTKMNQYGNMFDTARKAGMMRFTRLIGIVCLVSHFLACFWSWIATVWSENEVGYLEFTLGQKYAHCWSIVIGCLNASPPTMFTTSEEISVAVFMLIGNVLQATVFGNVAALIASFDEEEVAYSKKLISTYERCKFLDIPEPLTRRIQGYYENLYRETKSVNGDADAFINELSPALICEVKFQLYRDMLTQIPFLSTHKIDPTVIEMLILHLRTVTYMQDDIVTRKGEFGDWMGFIGSKGSVGVLDPSTQARKIIRILEKGDYFGEMALLQRAVRSTTTVALTWVQIHVLCRQDLEDVRAQYPSQARILEQEITKYMQSKVAYKMSGNQPVY